MRKLATALVPIVLSLLAGCSSTLPLTQSGSTALPLSTTANGAVHGGQGPVSNSLVQLWQVGTTGYGVGAAQLGTSVLSDANGNFSLTGLYDCTTGANGLNTTVYITAKGGNPGSGVNNELLMMAPLGRCGNLSASTFITINEVTTVATAYALAQFMAPDGTIGSYGYASGGLNNGISAFRNLTNFSTGVAFANTPTGNAVVPQAEINTLANMIAACVNTKSVGSSPSALCMSLFTAATPPGAIAPTNTLAAALNIARNPWFNAGPASTLFPLSAANPPFVPFLASAPNDWTIALSYAGGGLSVMSIAIEGSGAVWTANYASGANGNGTVSRLTTFGAPFIGSPYIGGGSIFGPYALALDTGGFVWVVNHDSNQIIQLNSTGNSISGPFQYSETSAPNAIAIDGHNNLWITNSGGTTVSETNVNNAGSSGALSGGGVNNPFAVAIDNSGNGWITNRSASSLSEFNTLDTAVSGAGGFTGGGLNFPISIAMDGSNSAWVVNSGASVLSKFTGGGTAVGSGFTIPGAGVASAVAVDGSGRVFVVKRTPALSVFDNAGTLLSGSTGLQGGNMSGPDAMAIDASGNVWIGNQSPVTVNGALQTVTEFIGVATPAITPLSFAQQIGQIGQKPGTPIPLAITSTTLPYYTPGAAFSADLHAAGGNTGTYAWTIVSGSLPASMSLSSSGTISGTSSATGTSTFTVKVCDAGNSANCTTSGTFSLTANTTLPTGGGESLLNGNYVMRFNGFNNNINGGFNGFATQFTDLFQITFNGTGGITAGEYDFNNPNGHGLFTGITGSYTLGTDHRGVMVLNLSSTVHFNFAISVGNLNGSSVAQDMHFIEFDDTLSAGAGNTGTGAGVGKLQSGVGGFSFAKSFVFGVQGETPCTLFNSNGCTNGVLSGFGAVTAVGRFTGDASLHITSGEEDAQTDDNGNGSDNNGNGYTGISLAGGYTAPDSFGRGTITLTATPSGAMYAVPPANYVYYIVSPTEIYILSTDSHANFTMLSGDVLAQTMPSALSGSYVLYSSDPVNGNGTNAYANSSGAQLIYITASGSQISVIQDSNNDNNGQLQLGQTLGPLPYAIDAAGRMTISGAGTHPPVFYLANVAQAFGTTGGGPGLLTVEQQSGGPFACNAFTGIYFLGDIASPVRRGMSSGIVVQNGTGVAAGTIDNSDPSGVLTQGQTGSVTCVADANGVNTASTGRISFTGTFGSSVGYVISPTRQVIISSTPGDTAPGVILIQK